MLFGGKSVEHEVSVISGIQAVMNMDTDKYEVIPVYMTKRNEMYIGEEIGKIESYKNIDELLKKSQRVIMTNEDGKVFLTPFPVDPAEIKANLISQLTSSVRWTESVNNMISAGANDFTECGPGKALQGMIGRINKNVSAHGIA